MSPEDTAELRLVSALYSWRWNELEMLGEEFGFENTTAFRYTTLVGNIMMWIQNQGQWDHFICRLRELPGGYP